MSLEEKLAAIRGQQQRRAIVLAVHAFMGSNTEIERSEFLSVAQEYIDGGS